MIAIEGLVKSYADLKAVDDLSLQVEAGQIFGMLGPNGAGKTSTIGCVCGLLRPTAGRVIVAGVEVASDPVAARRALGLVPQELALYDDLGVRENLGFWGRLHGLGGADLASRVDQVLELVGLTERAADRVDTLSGGMKRRLNFGCGVVHRPAVLLLDEPTVGVDPQSRVRLLDLVRAEAAAGTTVLYTTHYMEEAESLCDRLAIVDHGRVVTQGTLTELRGQLGEADLLRLSGRFVPEGMAGVVAALADVELLAATSEHLSLALASAGTRLPEIWSALVAAGAEVRETTVTRPSLESLFIKLTGRELR